MRKGKRDTRMARGKICHTRKNWKVVIKNIRKKKRDYEKKVWTLQQRKKDKKQIKKYAKWKVGDK